MSYQSGCHGRVVVGELPPDVRSRLADMPGEWLEYDPQTGVIGIRHVQPSTAPVLPTVTIELVRILSEIPYELQSRIEGGDLFVHTEEPATQLVRLRVENGGSLHIQWAHPEYAGARKEAWSDDFRIATPEWEHRLNGSVDFATPNAATAAAELQDLADTYEGLYPEGDFVASDSEDGGAVNVTMKDVNLDAHLLVDRLQALAEPGSLEGRFDVGSFADFVPENLVRILFEDGNVWVKQPLLWS